ncbi:hypothetical protein C8R45DRAFT_940591 [Mycena sanguinolenta]|nr:hypothetical protein C8R45DRAFT_940591 [Mycena sanguinolenta]
MLPALRLQKRCPSLLPCRAVLPPEQPVAFAAVPEPVLNAKLDAPEGGAAQRRWLCEKKMHGPAETLISTAVFPLALPVALVVPRAGRFGGSARGGGTGVEPPAKGKKGGGEEREGGEGRKGKGGRGPGTRERKGKEREREGREREGMCEGKVGEQQNGQGGGREWWPSVCSKQRAIRKVGSSP